MCQVPNTYGTLPYLLVAFLKEEDIVWGKTLCPVYRKKGEL
jgi:hypothetical protein